MTVFKKSANEILVDELSALNGTDITNTAPGSIARMLLEIPASSIEEGYNFTEQVSKNSFLSTASGDYLDRIGVLVGVVRDTDETDASLKYRISTAVMAHAKANQTAIKLAVEKVAGISEAVIAPGTAGAGSFTVYVIGKNPEEMTGAMLSAVVNAIKDVAAYGVHFDVLPIRYLDITVEIDVSVNKSVVVGDETAVKNAVQRYILSMRPGGLFSIVGLQSSIVNALGADRVVNVNIIDLYINGVRYTGNFQAGPDEILTVNRFVSEPIVINIRR